MPSCFVITFHTRCCVHTKANNFIGPNTNNSFFPNVEPDNVYIFGFVGLSRWSSFLSLYVRLQFAPWPTERKLHKLLMLVRVDHYSLRRWQRDIRSLLEMHYSVGGLVHLYAINTEVPESLGKLIPKRSKVPDLDQPTLLEGFDKIFSHDITQHLQSPHKIRVFLLPQANLIEVNGCVHSCGTDNIEKSILYRFVLYVQSMTRTSGWSL